MLTSYANWSCWNDTLLSELPFGGFTAATRSHALQCFERLARVLLHADVKPAAWLPPLPPKWPCEYGWFKRYNPAMRVRWVPFLCAFAALSYAQPQPNVAAQREAMKKLEFLVGKWSGEAAGVRGPGASFKVLQS